MPLFVEEMTKAVLEAASDPVLIASVPASSLGIPATLHASLLARLDRLGPAAKQVAQAGAAIAASLMLQVEGDRALVGIQHHDRKGCALPRGARRRSGSPCGGSILASPVLRDPIS